MSKGPKIVGRPKNFLKDWVLKFRVSGVKGWVYQELGASDFLEEFGIENDGGGQRTSNDELGVELDDFDNRFNKGDNFKNWTFLEDIDKVKLEISIDKF